MSEGEGGREGKLAKAHELRPRRGPATTLQATIDGSNQGSLREEKLRGGGNRRRQEIKSDGIDGGGKD